MVGFYFDLSADNTATATVVEPNHNATKDEAPGTGYEKNTMTGSWSLQGDSLSINLTDSHNNTFNFSGTVSQSSYPDCILSLSVSVSTIVPIHNQTTGIINLVAYQYPSDFNATNMTGTFNLTDSNAIDNSNDSQASSSGGPQISQLTLTATGNNTGTYLATADNQTLSGTFTFDNPVLTNNVQTQQGAIPEYIIVNPETKQFIALVYGLVNDQEQVTSQYQLYTPQ